MKDWNVVVSVKERGYAMARELLAEYGYVQRSTFHNVLAMKVPSLAEFLTKLEQRLQFNPDLLTYVSRIVPVTHAFDFDTPAEFEARLRELVPELAPPLIGKSFHVRMHRRGLKGRLVSPAEERFLDEALLKAVQEIGAPATIRFDDPDAIVDVETLDHRAGVALWTRDDLRRYPFLRPN